MKKVYVVIGIDFDGFKICGEEIKVFDNPVNAKRCYDIMSDTYQFAYYTQERVLNEFEYPYMNLKEDRKGRKDG